MNGLAQYLFHLICRKDTTRPNESEYDENYFRHGFDETARYFHRLGDRVDFIGKRVLDVGCGHGATCYYVALHGASQVIGIDIQEHLIEFARKKLCTEYRDLANTVDFMVVTDPQQMEGRKFDIILSKDSFEHIDNPKKYIHDLQQYLADDGIVVIGFGPLWKSPYGGHIGFMTTVPWVHLLFPESVILNERRRFRPDDGAERFDQVEGGLNKMTLKKFMDIMMSTDLEPLYLKTNVHDRKLTKIFNVLNHLPFCREYFTFNVYSIWSLKSSFHSTSWEGREALKEPTDTFSGPPMHSNP